MHSRIHTVLADHASRSEDFQALCHLLANVPSSAGVGNLVEAHELVVVQVVLATLPWQHNVRLCSAGTGAYAATTITVTGAYAATPITVTLSNYRGRQTISAVTARLSMSLQVAPPSS